MDLDHTTTNDNNNSTMETSNTSTAMTNATTNTTIKSPYHSDVVRLIGQYLTDKGLVQTAKSLLQESGLNQIDHPVAVKFKEFILTGDWDKASQLVEEIANLSVFPSSSDFSSSQSPYTSLPSNYRQQTVSTRQNSANNIKRQNGCSLNDNEATASTSRSTPNAKISTTSNSLSDIGDVKQQQLMSNIIAMRSAIAEQKFLELIDDDERIKALRCLRCEITPVCQDVKRVQFFTTLLMCKSQEETRLKANWIGKGQVTRRMLFEKLTRFIPPVMMLPPRRLESLLNQAIQFQNERCVLHLRKGSIYKQQYLGSKTINSSKIGSPTAGKFAPRGRKTSLLQNLESLEKRNSLRTIVTVRDILGCDGHCQRVSSTSQEQDDQQHQQRPVQDTQPSLMNINGSMNVGNSNPSSSNGDQVTGEPTSQAQACNDESITNKNSADGGGEEEDEDYYHDQIGLKSDHFCLANDFPLQTTQELDSHRREVWFCKFSNDGTKLATGGVGGLIKIWHLDRNKRKLVEKCTFECSQANSITCLSWSPNDVYLLACGTEGHPDLWVWNVNTEQMHQRIERVDSDSFTTCSWHMSGERFAGASIKGTFNIYDLNGNRCGYREGVRVQCLSFLHKDPNLILAADTLNRIKAYEVKDCSSTEMISIRYDENDVLEERHSIMSFVVDCEDQLIAVNLLEQGIHLWDLPSRSLLRVFVGVSQRNITIYSSFSGLDSTFLASGSEDGKVYIYHVDKDQPVAILNGHKRCVNCVSWNPKFPELLASVSDDHTIHLWAPVEASSTYHICRSISQTGLFSYTSQISTIHTGGDTNDHNHVATIG